MKLTDLVLHKCSNDHADTLDPEELALFWDLQVRMSFRDCHLIQEDDSGVVLLHAGDCNSATDLVATMAESNQRGLGNRPSTLCVKSGAQPPPLESKTIVTVLDRIKAIRLQDECYEQINHQPIGGFLAVLSFCSPSGKKISDKHILVALPGGTTAPSGDEVPAECLYTGRDDATLSLHGVEIETLITAQEKVFLLLLSSHSNQKTLSTPPDKERALQRASSRISMHTPK